MTANKLTISSNSWHYKVYKFGPNYREVTNLCSYFWSVVGTIFLVFMLYVLGTLTAYMATAAIVNPFVTLGVWLYLGFPLSITFFGYIVGGTGFAGIPITWPGVIFWMLPSILVWGIVAVLGYNIWAGSESGKKWAKKRETTAHLGFRGLASEYYWAFKGKYCPQLTVVDEDK